MYKGAVYKVFAPKSADVRIWINSFCLFAKYPHWANPLTADTFHGQPLNRLTVFSKDTATRYRIKSRTNQGRRQKNFQGEPMEKISKNSTIKPPSTIFVPCMNIRGRGGGHGPPADAHETNICNLSYKRIKISS